MVHTAAVTYILIPKTGATHCHVQLGLPDKGLAIIGLLSEGLMAI